MGGSIEERAYALVAEDRGIKLEKLTPESTLSQDLGMDGDDAVEFFENFEKEFSADLKGLGEDWHCYFSPEGMPQGAALLFILPGSIILSDSSTDVSIRKEFNRRAEAGHGEGMEQDHLPITLPVLEKMRLAPTDNLLDVGCGAGWLSRRLAKLVPEGRVVGMDISDEMIRHARRASVDFGNLMFVTGEVAEIPWQPHFFSHAISVESSYYWPDPAAGIKDIYRVLHDGGSAWTLINYYRDNPHCHQWGELLAVPTRLLSAEEWAELFRRTGFTNVEHERVVDGSPSPAVYTGRWFRDAEQLRACKAEGALLVHGTK